MKLRNLLIALLLLGAFSTGFAQDTGQVRIDIHEINDANYPNIDVFFSAYNVSTGRIIPNIRSDIITASINGQPIEVANVADITGANRTVQIMLLFDLTSSVNSQFLDEQKRTAYSLVDALDVNDQVGVAIFSNSDAEVGIPMTPDHNAALNYIDTLSIIQGPSNRFLDGVFEAVNAFGDVSATDDSRRAVVVLTDVENPNGSRVLDEIVNLANQRDVDIHVIGFGDVDSSVIEPFAARTDGFVYLQRELEDTLERLAVDVTEVVSNEYSASFRANAPANGQPANLQIKLDLGPNFAGQTTTTVTTTSRTIDVSFPNLQPGEPLSGNVTFEPSVVYTGTDETPNIAKVGYYISRPNGTNDVLRADNTVEQVFIWDTSELAGGEYNILIEITDAVGNVGRHIQNIRVASPLEVSFSQPILDPQTNEARVQGGDVPIAVNVVADYGISEVKLFVNDEQVGTALTDPPFSFIWNTGSSSGAGLYSLRAEAVDVNNDRAFAELPVRVEIASSELPIFIIGIVLAILVVVVGVALTIVSRRNRQIEEEVPAVIPHVPSNEQVPMPPPPVQTGPGIVLLRPIKGRYTMNNGAMSIGRANSNDVQLPDTSKKVSRQHAQIRMEGGQYVFYNYRPENPSTINNMQITNQHILRDGDRITIYEYEMVFTLNPEQYQ